MPVASPLLPKVMFHVGVELRSVEATIRESLLHGKVTLVVRCAVCGAQVLFGRNGRSGGGGKREVVGWGRAGGVREGGGVRGVRRGGGRGWGEKGQGVGGHLTTAKQNPIGRKQRLK